MVINSDIIIIGAGPIGIFASFCAGMLGMKVSIVDALDKIGGQCSTLYPEKPIFDIPGFPEILAKDLIKNLIDQSAKFNPNYYLKTCIINIIKKDDNFILKTDNDQEFSAKIIIFASGGGFLTPNKLQIENASIFENKSIFYSIENKEIFRDKTIAIAGGGDSAIDWCLELSKVAKKIILIHRRDIFKAMSHGMEQIKSLIKSEILELQIPFSISKLNGDEKNRILKSIEISNENEKINIECNFLLPFFGLMTKNDLAEKINLETHFNNIIVNPATFESNIENIFATGDCCTYPGKLKLILCGFSEAAIAMRAIYEKIYHKKPYFQYSTMKKFI